MFCNSIKFTFLITIFLLVFSCGKSTDQDIKDKILDANILLSTSECQPAIDLLESIGRQNSNTYYLKTLSTAYACRAGYSSVILFATDIDKTSNPGPLGGTTTYTTSDVRVSSPLTDDLKYRDLQTAIDILLYAGGIPLGTDPSGVERSARLSANDAADVNTQIAFMMMAQAGKFMKVYANAKNGIKGDGSGNNKCFTDYSTFDDTLFQGLYTSGVIGACNARTSPHPELNSIFIPEIERKKRLCEGVVLFNGILDLLPNIIISIGGTQFGNLGAQLNYITIERDNLKNQFPEISAVVNVLSQKKCESDPLVTKSTLEIYYVALIETLIE